MRARLYQYALEAAIALLIALLILVVHATSYEQLLFVYQGR